MDISAIPIIHKLSHLPMTADPSHGTGRRDKVPPMARASVAAGAKIVRQNHYLFRFAFLPPPHRDDIDVSERTSPGLRAVPDVCAAAFQIASYRAV